MFHNIQKTKNTNKQKPNKLLHSRDAYRLDKYIFQDTYYSDLDLNIDGLSFMSLISDKIIYNFICEWIYL